MSKYGSKITERHGISFASKAEADYHDILLEQEKEGRIADLVRQPKFLFEIDGRPLMGYKGKRQMSYVADFAFTSLMAQDPVRFVVDVKGWPTKDFMIKWALVRHLYPDRCFMLYSKKKGLHPC